MNNIAWVVLSNIAVLAAVCFLVTFTGSAWWALLLLFMGSYKSST